MSRNTTTSLLSELCFGMMNQRFGTCAAGASDDEPRRVRRGLWFTILLLVSQQTIFVGGFCPPSASSTVYHCRGGCPPGATTTTLPMLPTRRTSYHVANNEIGILPMAQGIKNWNRPLSQRCRESTRSFTALPDKSSDNDDDYSTISSKPVWWNRISEDPKRSIRFSILMSISGAMLGPFLDSYHSAFGVLQYNEPIQYVLWGNSEYPALTTAWWVPALFGLAGFIIGWLYILLDAILLQDVLPPDSNSKVLTPSPPKIFLGISFFTLQYWLSGCLVQAGVDRTSILNLMSVFAAIGFAWLDGTLSGLITSAATGLGGPLIEVGLIWCTAQGILAGGGYHYTDLGETGFFPLWILPVYFLGGPANGNLARGFWNWLSSNKEETISANNTRMDRGNETDQEPACPVCNDTRCTPCPNCDGIGNYVAMGGRTVTCTSCTGRGFVICRSCFDRYDDDPYDFYAIRDKMSRMPD